MDERYATEYQEMLGMIDIYAQKRFSVENGIDIPDGFNSFADIGVRCDKCGSLWSSGCIHKNELLK
jgi:hypothetical protein